MSSFNKLANLHNVFFKKAGPPIGNTKGSDNRPPAPPRPIGLPKGSDERPPSGMPIGLSKKGPEEGPAESPRTPKMMPKKGPEEGPADPRRPQIPGLQKGNREDWDKNQRSNFTAKSTGREPTQVELRHIMPHSGFKLDPKEPAWKSDREIKAVRFGSDEPKRTALNTAHTPAPYSSPPDDPELAYQSRLKQEFDDYTFANPFGERDLKSNRIFMNNRLGGILRAEGQRPEGQRPNGPGSDIRPPSEIEQRFTLPGHLKRPPFDKKDPTYGLE